jgi:integrator complex subunit 11
MHCSAHADAKGILQLIRMAQPAHVMLVHGEAHKMEFLQQRIEKEFGVPCYFPANGHTVTIAKAPAVPVLISPALLKRHARDEAEAEAEAEVKRTRNEAVDGVIVAAEGEVWQGVEELFLARPLVARLLLR